MDQVKFAESNACRNGALEESQIRAWRENGFTLVHDLLPDELLQAARQDAARHFPDPREDQAGSFTSFGSAQRFVFPSMSEACNEITLHPNLLAAVAALLDVAIPELRLTQSDLWPKYGRDRSDEDYDNRDQRMHCDYPNHMLTHPPPWHDPAAVEMIIYLSDFEQCEGATAVVPRQGDTDPAYRWPIVDTPGVGSFRYINNRDRAEAYLRDRAPAVAAFREQDLYPREVLARYRFGSVLFYRHDTWHRGTPVRQGALRLVHNLTFRKDSADWINTLHPGWSWAMYRPDQFLEKLIARLSWQQRSVIGFPPPGHEYWNDATIAAVEARYGNFGIDMAPYRAAVTP